MGGSLTSIVLLDLFNAEKLVAERHWEILHEGVYISPIYTAAGNAPQAAFLRYLPGSSIPEHIHPGFEHILILSGSQQDGDKVYKQGSLVIHWPGTSHRISSMEGCLALGIWESPVAFQAAGL